MIRTWCCNDEQEWRVHGPGSVNRFLSLRGSKNECVNYVAEEPSVSQEIGLNGLLADAMYANLGTIMCSKVIKTVTDREPD